MSSDAGVILLVTGEDLSSGTKSAVGRQLREFIEQLTKLQIDVLTATTYHDAYLTFYSKQSIAAIIVDWDIEIPPRDAKVPVIPINVTPTRKLHALHAVAHPKVRPRSRSRSRSPAKGRPDKGVGGAGGGGGGGSIGATTAAALAAHKQRFLATPQHHVASPKPEVKLAEAQKEEEEVSTKELSKEQLVELVSLNNKHLPIFLLTVKFSSRTLDTHIRRQVDEFIWKLEDTPKFLAGRIKKAVQEYEKKILPPFFKGLVEYSEESKYSWHTPGHMGGVAFLKSPPGTAFFKFIGENVLRADLSVSVPEMGSLLEHSGLVGEAEALAAQTFGADRTYFVTNGTSTGNKIVYNACVTAGDTVLIDRNCHKSLMQVTVMTSSVPQFLKPLRNARGIIGPVPLSEFDKFEGNKFKLAVLTNSTYDGICYNVPMVVDKTANYTDNMMFDEAWFPHARFHPVYQHRYGMCMRDSEHQKIPVYSTQSTHKLLAALSQGSMVHVCDKYHNAELFNDAYMMHTSTSPQYSIIASLDVSCAMMAQSGLRMIDSTLTEAIVLRKALVEIGDKEQKWWFGVWQPDELRSALLKKWEDISAPPEEHLLKLKDPHFWTLKPNEKWHGFGDIAENFAMLDPLKVTVLTPGVSIDGKLEEWGIPAAIVSKYLRNRRIVVEKTDFYSFLIIFSIAVTKGKSGTLVSALLDFKQDLDHDEKLIAVFPDVAHIPQFQGVTLSGFSAKMHQFYVENKLIEVIHDVYDTLPPAPMLPSIAYKHQVNRQVELVSLDKLEGRISSVLVVPYPPGIPVVMPGEVVEKSVVHFLQMQQKFDHLFPGFEMEIHGVVRGADKQYYIYCVKEDLEAEKICIN